MPSANIYMNVGHFAFLDQIDAPLKPVVSTDTSDPEKLCAFFDTYPEDDELFNIIDTDKYGSDFAKF